MKMHLQSFEGTAEHVKRFVNQNVHKSALITITTLGNLFIVWYWELEKVQSNNEGGDEVRTEGNY